MKSTMSVFSSARCLSVTLLLSTLIMKVSSQLYSPPSLKGPDTWPDSMKPIPKSIFRVFGNSYGPYLIDDDPAIRQHSQSHQEAYTPVNFVSKGANPAFNIPDLTSAELKEEIESLDVFGKSVLELITSDEFSVDGMLIMRKGNIVYERYFPKTSETAGIKLGFGETTRHNLYSMTKSYMGTMINMLKHDGLIDSFDDLVSKYIPIIAESEAFRDVTIRQVLDMSNEFQYLENDRELRPQKCMTPGTELFQDFFSNMVAETDITAVDTKNEWPGKDLTIPLGCEQSAEYYATSPSYFRSPYWQLLAGSKGKLPTTTPVLNKNFWRFPGPSGARESLLTWKKGNGPNPNGEKYTYRSANTLLLAWLAEVLLLDSVEYTGSVDYWSKRVWSKIGASSDGIIRVDDTGFPLWQGGFSATLRDVALYGEMIRNDGRNMNGEQIIDESIIKMHKENGNESQFAKSEEGGRNILVNATAGYPYPYLDAIGKPQGLTGWVYHDQYRVVKNNIIMQEGIYGQHNWVDLNAETVIAVFSSRQNQIITSGISMDLIVLAINTHFINKDKAKVTKKSTKKGIKSTKSKKSRKSVVV